MSDTREKEKYSVSEIQVVEGDSLANEHSGSGVVPEIEDEEVVLARDFKTRHVSMIAIAGAIGTGLIIGSGTGLQRGGPASLFLGYVFTGGLLMVVLMSLGEMAAF